MSNKLLKQAYSCEARRILSELYGKTITENELEKEESGRPYIRGAANIDFNISHSGALVAVSYADKTQTNHHIGRTGCDVELVRLRKNAEGIAKKFFSPNERDYICDSGRIDEIRFYQIWTLKESFIKLRGLSVFDMAKYPSFINSEGQFFNQCELTIFYQYELTGRDGERYILTTALENQPDNFAQQPVIKWFSEAVLNCSLIVSFWGKMENCCVICNTP